MRVSRGWPALGKVRLCGCVRLRGEVCAWTGDGGGGDVRMQGYARAAARCGEDSCVQPCLSRAGEGRRGHAPNGQGTGGGAFCRRSVQRVPCLWKTCEQLPVDSAFFPQCTGLRGRAEGSVVPHLSPCVLRCHGAIGVATWLGPKLLAPSPLALCPWMSCHHSSVRTQQCRRRALHWIKQCSQRRVLSHVPPVVAVILSGRWDPWSIQLMYCRCALSANCAKIDL